MRSDRYLPYSGICLVMLVLVIGCPTGPSEEELALAAMQTDFQAIQEEFTSLQALRAEEQTARTTVAELEAVSERNRTDEQKAQLEELTAKIPELVTSKDTAYEQLQEKLAAFLNTGLNNFPTATETMEGLRIYAEEAMANADDIVLKSGDYKKAIDSMTQVREYYGFINAEPLPALDEKIAELDDWRFITEERYDMIKNGMSPDEVKEIAGIPYYGNIRENPNKTTTWMFRRRDGGVAAITFNTKNKVYHRNFDAVKPKVVKEGEGEGE